MTLTFPRRCRSPRKKAARPPAPSVRSSASGNSGAAAPVSPRAGLARRAVVSVVRQGLYRGAVAAGTGPASASYDVDAATMHMERHERGIHALRSGADEADVADAPFRRVPRSAMRRGTAPLNLS